MGVRDSAERATRPLHLAEPAGLAVEIQLRLPEPCSRRDRVPRSVRDDRRRRHTALGARREHGCLQRRPADDLCVLDGHLERHGVHRRQPHAAVARLGLGLVRRRDVAVGRGAGDKAPRHRLDEQLEVRRPATYPPMHPTGTTGRTRSCGNCGSSPSLAAGTACSAPPSKRFRATSPRPPHSPIARSTAVPCCRGVGAPTSSNSTSPGTRLRTLGSRSAAPPDGSRHTNIGKYGAELYVDRAPSDQSRYSLATYTRAAEPIDATRAISALAHLRRHTERPRESAGQESQRQEGPGVAAGLSFRVRFCRFGLVSCPGTWSMRTGSAGAAHGSGPPTPPRQT